MLKAIQDALTLREEKVTLAGQELVVRELAVITEVPEGERSDAFYRMMVACVFDPEGKPAFEVADLPAIKAASRRALRDVIEAVQRVNGLNVEAEAKN